jgi:hypothetical protein
MASALDIYRGPESLNHKARENRLRRMAERRGFRLEKCRRRDQSAIGYGMYRLINVQTESPVGGQSRRYELTLGNVEKIMESDGDGDG